MHATTASLRRGRMSRCSLRVEALGERPVVGEEIVGDVHSGDPTGSRGSRAAARAVFQRASSSLRCRAIVSGSGGQPGIRRSTGSMSSTRPAISRRIAEQAAAERAVAERGHPPRLGHRRVGGLAAAARIRVVTAPVTSSTSAWRGEATIDEAEAREVVGRARRRLQLVLAAVARAGVDVAQLQRAARAPGAAARPRSGCAGAGAGGRTSAVHAGVAELEALVDEREVGEDRARRGPGDRRPVGVRARCAGARAAPGRRPARRRRRSRRAGSRPGRRRGAAAGPPAR